MGMTTNKLISVAYRQLYGPHERTRGLWLMLIFDFLLYDADEYAA